MSRKREPYILAYDIADKNRLRRVHKLLKSWGMPVQYSVFAVDLTTRGADTLFEALARITDPDADDVRLYRIGQGAHCWSGRAPMPDGMILTGSASATILKDMASSKVDDRNDRADGEISRRKRIE